MTLLDFSGFRRDVDWSNQQIAEFYRVESALVQARIPVEIERGVSDEGDPWLVFAHVETGDIVVHFARESGVYIAAVPSIPWVSRGSDLRELIAEFMRSHPVLLPSREEKKGNVLLHPGALFTAFVATAFYLDGFRVADAQAGEQKAAVRTQHPTTVQDQAVAADAEREYFSKAALLAAVVIAVGVGREHALNLISGAADPSADRASDDIKAILAAATESNLPLPVQEDGAHENASASTLLAAAPEQPPPADEISGERLIGGRPEEVEGLASTRPEVTPIAHLEEASTPSPPAAQQADVPKEHAPEEASPAQSFAGSVPHQSEPSADGATSSAAILSFVFDIAPETLSAGGGNLFLDQVISWIDQNAGASQPSQPTPELSVAPPGGAPAAPQLSAVIHSETFEDDVHLDLIGAFLRSDIDIVTIVGQSGIVIYDESELASGSGEIEIQTWQLADAQLISLIGSATFFDQYYASHPIA